MMSRAVLALLVFLTGCTAATARPEPVATPPDVRPPVIVAASAEGAVVADNQAEAFYGLDRAGKEVWRDAAAYTAGAEDLDAHVGLLDVLGVIRWSMSGRAGLVVGA
ncbi:hypothetical protein, partial [Nonomuraea sp. NPDC049400]|uniref:hypothetical protein n=1 Tax=Nonomuraea sp. NPDC049400 TaxID=3364352 RepID=UPI00379E057C